jgi:cation/acetate symporter
MPVMHLAKAVGGDIFLGFLSAVAFATILAVVSGLALAGASANSHDLYARVIKKGQASSANELKVTRMASVFLGIAAIGLGIAFKDQNVLFLVALAFGVASSVNFPVLILSMYWKGLTTRGALWGGIAGLVSSVGLVILSPTVWVKILGNQAAIFPYDHPAIVSMTLAFFVTWLMSVTDKSTRAAKEAEAYEEQFIRAQTGLGAEGAHAH